MMGRCSLFFFFLLLLASALLCGMISLRTQEPQARATPCSVPSPNMPDASIMRMDGAGVVSIGVSAAAAVRVFSRGSCGHSCGGGTAAHLPLPRTQQQPRLHVSCNPYTVRGSLPVVWTSSTCSILASNSAQQPEQVSVGHRSEASAPEHSSWWESLSHAHAARSFSAASSVLHSVRGVASPVQQLLGAIILLAFAAASQSCRLEAMGRLSPMCRPHQRPLPFGVSLPSLLLLSSFALLLSFAPTAADASCNVTAPVNGMLGNCTASLATNATCSMQCSLGFVLAAMPPQTSCSETSLTPQTCTLCAAGTTLTWDPSSLAKLVGTSAVGTLVYQGQSVSLSADGNTLAVGGYGDNSGAGATWLFTRSGSTWTQQGTKLVGTGAVGNSNQGWSVSLSADGNTLAVGGYEDNNQAGATWLFTRSGSTWMEQGSKLVGTGSASYYLSGSYQGCSVSLSADGNTLAVGGYFDNNQAGATWVFTRSNNTWTQQGTKLVGTGATGSAWQGQSVSLSADGNTLAVGGYYDNNLAGATWVFTRSNNTWTQQGTKLVGTGATGSAWQGQSVSLSADGNTLAVGGHYDNSGAGATWLFTRSGSTWTQQGTKLVGTGAVGNSNQGQSVSLSADGNMLAVGGYLDIGSAGATWLFTRSGSTWMEQGSKLVGTGVVGPARQGSSVSLSGDGITLAVGGYYDNYPAGATWAGSMRGLCDACLPGTFAATSGSSQCSQCDIGTYQDLSGQSSCSSCSIGYSSSAGASLCDACLPGTFTASDGATSCVSCDPGRFQNASAASVCSDCSAGFFSAAAQSTVCTICVAGSFAPTGSTACSLCSAGKFQYSTGTSSCIDCAAGSYGPTVGATDPSMCTPCGPGTHSSIVGASSFSVCTPCTRGSASSSPGSAVCSLCSPGYYSDAPGAYACTACPANTYNPAQGADSTVACLPCPSYAPNSPQGSSSFSQCSVGTCPPGYYTADGSQLCETPCPVGYSCNQGVSTPCQPGSYVSTTGATACSPCGPGRYGSSTRSSSDATCLGCPLASFSNVSLSSSCVVCPLHSTTLSAGSVSVDQCAPIAGCTESTTLGADDVAGQAALCPLSASAPVPLGSLLPNDALRLLQRNAAVSAANQSSSNYYQPLTTSSSLRLAVSGSDATLNAARATGSTPTYLTQANANLLDATAVVLLITLLSAAALPLLVYRKVPAKIAQRFDRFSSSHPTVIDVPPTPYPTQLGAALTWAFLCSSILVVVLLATASNVQTINGVVPPSSIENAGTAVANFEFTLRAHSSAATVAAYCNATAGTTTSSSGPAGYSISAQTGFSSRMQLQLTATGSGSCGLTANCLGCGLTSSAPQISFQLPFDAQLVEWEVWVSRASPSGWTRNYGLLQQQPDQLLDAEGQLQMQLMESYYSDDTASGSIESGFEMSYVGYEQLVAQSPANYSAAASVTVQFLFSRSDVVFQSVVSSKQSVLQQLTVILSAVSSLFAGFAIAFGLLEGHLFKQRSGHVSLDSRSGEAYVRSEKEAEKQADSGIELQVVKPGPAATAASAATDKMIPSPLHASDSEFADMHNIAEPSRCSPNNNLGVPETTD